MTVGAVQSCLKRPVSKIYRKKAVNIMVITLKM